MATNLTGEHIVTARLTLVLITADCFLVNLYQSSRRNV